MALPLLKPAETLGTLLLTPQDHYDTLHSDAIGTSIVWERKVGQDSGKGNWLKLGPNDPHIPALLNAQSGMEDRYLSVNEFYSWRITRNLRSLRACYVDIDGCTDLRAALELLREARLPAPTAAMFSGRGLHLYWVHTPTPRQALPVWQACQDALVKALLPIGSDLRAKDCTRVLRLAGSVNRKSSTEVHGVVLDPQPYDFRHLCDEVLGHRVPRRKPATVRDLTVARAKRGVTESPNSYRRWYLVYQDLLAIARWYDFGGVPEGYRNTWLHLTAVAMSWFANKDTLAIELGLQAKTWTPGVSAAEVCSTNAQHIKRAEMAAKGETVEWNGKKYDPRFRYRRSTLLSLLQPIIPPELAKDLRAIISDEQAAKNRIETKRAYDSTRDRIAEGRHKSTQRGAVTQPDSVEQQKPWDALGISRRTYYSRKKAGTL